MIILRYNHMDPQDLLYTNQFVSTNILNSKELKNSTKYYKQFQNHIDKNSNITKEYLSRNLKDGDPININKSKSKPWPVSNEKNYKPIFSDAVSDIIENKYIKAVRTIISIYSKDRNKEKSLVPNNYLINLGKEFINIYKIKLIDLNIPNTIPPVNEGNNIISWIYPTLNLLNTTNSSESIYPFLDSYDNLYNYFFYYSTYDTEFKDSHQNILPDKNNSIIKEPFDLYTAVFNQGFYNTSQLEKHLKSRMNSILHKEKEGIISSYITSLIGEDKSRYSIESRLLRNSPHNFYINIDPYTSISTIINRAENINIIAIQTLPQTSMFSPTYNESVKTEDEVNYNFDIDIFWYFFYYQLNKHIKDLNPDNFEKTKYSHYYIMSGRYLFNREQIFEGAPDSNFLKGIDNNINLSGAELEKNAPSFIITVKDIGHLFGGINNNDPFRSGTLFNTNQKYIYENNCYPIVFTDMPSIGGIDKNLINEVEFYDLYFLYEFIKLPDNATNYQRLQKVVSFYYHFDDIRIGTEVFKRYAFYIHTNSFLKRSNMFFKQAGFINCHTQENIILSKSIYDILSSGISKNCGNDCEPATFNTDTYQYTKNYNNCFEKTTIISTEDSTNQTIKNIVNNSLNICFFGDYITGEQIKEKNPICGRALPFAFKHNFDFNKDTATNTCNFKRSSILTLLGWSNDDKNVSKYSPFKFIHRNIDTIPTTISEYSNIISNKKPHNNTDGLIDLNKFTSCNNIEYNFSSIPNNLLNLEQIGTDIFVFRSIPFIFLRLTFPSLAEDTISNQLIKTTSDKLDSSNMYDEYYVNPLTNTNDLGSNYQSLVITDDDSPTYESIKIREKIIADNCGFKTSSMLLKKDADIIFAKINLNPVPGNAFNKQHYDYEFIFYDKPLQSVNTMKVELLSPEGELLNFRQDHNMTLEIMEFRDVLKETLFDTRHGEIVTTGIKKV